MEIEYLKKSIEREIAGANTDQTIRDISIHYRNINWDCEHYPNINPHQKAKVKSLRTSSLLVLSQIASPVVLNLIQHCIQTETKNPQQQLNQ